MCEADCRVSRAAVEQPPARWPSAARPRKARARRPRAVGSLRPAHPTQHRGAPQVVVRRMPQRQRPRQGHAALVKARRSAAAQLRAGVPHWRCDPCRPAAQVPGAWVCAAGRWLRSRPRAARAGRARRASPPSPAGVARSRPWPEPCSARAWRSPIGHLHDGCIGIGCAHTRNPGLRLLAHALRVSGSSPGFNERGG